MAGSSRAELSTSGLDGPAFSPPYTNGQRGVHASSGFERSGSFREGSESRGNFAGSAGMSRSGAASPVEPPPLLQYLTLEPLSMGEQKCLRSGELRRALGVTAEEQSFGLVQTKPFPAINSEELKRIKGSVVESSSRARDRAKSLQESIQKLDKYRNVLTRKRQRSDMSTEKVGSSNSLRMGAQNHQNPMENFGQRLEDRAKNVVTNKRVRSSLADARLEGRSSVAARQSPSVDNEKSLLLEKDKCSIRASNVATVVSEEKLRGLPPGGEGWEKKLKRKRSVGTMLNRGNDGDRDVKQPGQHRPNNESRARSNDGLGFRHGPSAGALGSSKMDGTSQQNNAGSRFVPKTDAEYGSLPNERRERFAGVDKERVMTKNKVHSSEDAQAGSLSPLTKGKACRAPRTSSIVVMNSSSSFQRSSGGIDEWEEAPCQNKVPPAGGVTNRKRPTPPSASSPPVAWVGQRPPKMSRTRRANVVSPVSNFDEAQTLTEGLSPDVASKPTPIESCGLLPPRGIPSNNLQTMSKTESISSPLGLSESEESGATENKSKEKVTNSSEVENGGANAVHNATNLILPSKKNRVPLKEEVGDGIRRQGRSGRGTMQVKACSSVTKENLDTIETSKPPKNGRPSYEKNESKVGRPPTKKVSDRKSSARNALVVNCGSTDLAAESDDDREELLAAANAARSAITGAYPGYFWKKMEPMFTSVSSEDSSFLKHQITFAEELERSMCVVVDDEHNMMVSTNCSSGPLTMSEVSSQVLPSSNTSASMEQSEMNGVGPKKSTGLSSPNDDPRRIASQKIETDRWFEEMLPLSHRLLSCFVEEESNESSQCNSEQGDIILRFSNDYIPYITNRHLENEREANAVKSNVGLGLDFKYSNGHSAHKNLCNGFTASSNFTSSNIQNSIYGENLLDETNVAGHPENSPSHELMPHISRQCQDLGKSFSASPYEYQYGHMSLDDRILIELQNIDIYPETVPKLDDGEDEDINKVISELQMRLYEQVKQKKCKLHKLEKAIQEAKHVEERNLEQLAMNKLVEMAYKKLMGGRGGSSHKGGASKMSKQLALAFAKRTLARCHKYEETGQSCFSEPALWTVLSAPLHTTDAKLIEGGTSGIIERPKHGQKLDRSPLDARTPEQSLGGAKWKKGDRERDRHKDSAAKSSSAKSSRHSSSSGRSERKTKTKPKQKLVQLSTSGSVLGRVTEAPDHSTFSMHESRETMSALSAKLDQEIVVPSSANAVQDSSKETNAALTSLPLNGLDSLDILDVPEDLGGQGQDGFWAGVDEDSLQDQDLAGGLAIPLDDLDLFIM